MYGTSNKTCWTNILTIRENVELKCLFSTFCPQFRSYESHACVSCCFAVVRLNSSATAVLFSLNNNYINLLISRGIRNDFRWGMKAKQKLRICVGCWLISDQTAGWRSYSMTQEDYKSVGLAVCTAVVTMLVWRPGTRPSRSNTIRLCSGCMSILIAAHVGAVCARYFHPRR